MFVLDVVSGPSWVAFAKGTEGGVAWDDLWKVAAGLLKTQE
jgi:hypothetical protein